MKSKKVYTIFEVVKDARASDFNRRCKNAMKVLELVPTDEEHSLFGTRTLDPETRNNYLSKVRAFVSFLLDTGKYDDSLLPFHPRCPRGVIAVSAKAASEFMHVVFAKEGLPVVNNSGNAILNAEGVQFKGQEQ